MYYIYMYTIADVFMKKTCYNSIIEYIDEYPKTTYFYWVLPCVRFHRKKQQENNVLKNELKIKEIYITLCTHEK